jgi:hypothetical protein
MPAVRYIYARRYSLSPGLLVFEIDPILMACTVLIR